MSMRYQANAHAAFEKYAAKRIQRGTNLILSIQKIYPIHKSLARIVAVTNNGEWNRNDFVEAIAHIYDNKVAVLDDAITDLSSDYIDMASLFVVPNTKTRPYTDNHLKGMKLISANVFAEDDDKIWEVRGEGDDRVLVQLSNDNLEDILNTRRERTRMATASLHVLDEFDFNNGDYIMYLSKSENIRGGYGIHIAGIPDSYVFDRKDQNLVRIVPAQIIDVASGLEDDYCVRFDFPHRAKANLTRDELNIYLDYMRRLFKGTAYFAKLEQLIRQKTTLPDTTLLHSDEPVVTE